MEMDRISKIVDELRDIEARRETLVGELHRITDKGSREGRSERSATQRHGGRERVGRESWRCRVCSERFGSKQEAEEHLAAAHPRAARRGPMKGRSLRGRTRRRVRGI